MVLDIYPHFCILLDMTNRHHLKHTGKGVMGAREACDLINRLYDGALRHFKKRAVADLYVSGTCSPDPAVPVSYSVTAYGGTPDEIEWFKDNAAS